MPRHGHHPHRHHGGRWNDASAADRLRHEGHRGGLPAGVSRPLRSRSSTCGLTLLEDNSEYSAGTHLVDVGVMNNRYDDQLIELARIINGEIENPYPYEHEFIVQETLLAAAGYTSWGESLAGWGEP